VVAGAVGRGRATTAARRASAGLDADVNDRADGAAERGRVIAGAAEGSDGTRRVATSVSCVSTRSSVCSESFNRCSTP
jgi:hypothetical protein